MKEFNPWKSWTRYILEKNYLKMWCQITIANNLGLKIDRMQLIQISLHSDLRLLMPGTRIQSQMGQTQNKRIPVSNIQINANISRIIIVSQGKIFVNLIMIEFPPRMSISPYKMLQFKDFKC